MGQSLLFLLACECPDLLAPFDEKTLLSLLTPLSTFVETSGPYMWGSVFGIYAFPQHMSNLIPCVRAC